MSFPRVLPVGDAAATVEIGDTLSLATNRRVRALDRALARARSPGLLETVPALSSLLVLYDPAVVRFADVVSEVHAAAAARPEKTLPPRRHTVPTVYGGEHGEDLEPLARSLGRRPAELVAQHALVEYTVLMLGFTPGFAYMGLLAGGLDVPRRDTPRVRVPAGSVAVAGRQTAVYPQASPGGWQLLGRTSLRLFDPRRERAALLAPGDRVRFTPVAELPAVTDTPTAPPAHPRPPAIEVLEPGLLTTIQDGGRRGHRRIGVGAAGPVDRSAHGAANRAVGNDEDAAALECTIAGPSIRFLAPLRFAIAGADLGATLERADLDEPWPVPRGVAVFARPGNVLRFGERRSGCRAMLAFAGGLDVPHVLGSASTDVGAGLGGLAGRALGAGDRLAVRGGPRGSEVAAPITPIADTATVRVVLGPQADRLEPESLRDFLATAWRVGTTSDRVGLRLEGGAPLRHRGRAEILSDGMVPGCVQVPPDGRPIVMCADGPTTGGYPKVATVVTADLPLLAQLLPGKAEVRFEPVSVEDVQGG